MEKLLIFTNYDSLQNVNDLELQKLNFNNGNFATNKIFKHTNNSTFQIASIINEGNIFLIYDEIEATEFKNFIDNYDDKKVGILYHKKGGVFKIELINEFTYTKEGTHDSDGDHYPVVLKILSDDEDKKFERLKDAIFKFNKKLNAALEFLHQSLGDTPVNEAILTQGDDKFDLEKLYDGNKLKDWICALNKKSGEDYREALRKVRDVLLMEAEIY